MDGRNVLLDLKLDINDIKNGMTVIVEGNLYQIVDFLHVKPGKGAAFMKTKLKNLRTGGTIEKTFNTNILKKQIFLKKQCNIYIILLICIILWI